MLISRNIKFLSLARKLLVMLVVQIQLQKSFGATQILPIQVPNSSYYSQNQNTQIDNIKNYDADQGDYYSGSNPQVPARVGKLYQKDYSGISNNNFGAGFGSNVNTPSSSGILNTISNYGSKFWSSSDDTPTSESSYGIASDSQHSGAVAVEDDNTSYGSIPAVATTGILGSGSSSYNHLHDHGHGWSYPTKNYHYQVYPGNKGWTSHAHQPIKHHNTGWNGWTSQGTGWNSPGTGWGNDSGFGHEIIEKLESWLGIKSVKGGTIVTIFKSLIIVVPVAVLLVVAILLLPIPVIVLQDPNRRRSVSGKVGDDSSSTSLTGSGSRLWKETGRITQLVVDSDSCVERISCEIGKMARKYNQHYLIDTIMRFLPVNSNYTERISRSLKEGEFFNNNGKEASNNSHSSSGQNSLENSCKKFTCDPVGRLKREFNRIWNKSMSRSGAQLTTKPKSIPKARLNSKTIT